MRVVNQKDQPVPLNTTGSIQIRNRSLLMEYFGNEELTKQSFAKGGWFRNGDFGEMIEGGRLVISGRDKDIISRGTRKILPGHIEDVVKRMEGVQQVSVVPIPDERLGEEICVCFIAAKDGDIHPSDVEAYCRTRFLSSKSAADGIGEMPKYFLKFDSFPLLSNGKRNKNKLKIIANDKLNTTEN